MSATIWSDDIRQDDRCFCCGAGNDRGLKLHFSYPEEGKATAQCRIPEYFTGWQSITHGGFLSMLLDEAMAHACLSTKRFMVTAQLNVRFLKPVRVGETIRVEAEVKESKVKLAQTQGSIYGPGGEVVARGSAMFLAPSL